MSKKTTKSMSDGNAQKYGSKEAELTKKDIALRVMFLVPLYLGLLTFTIWGSIMIGTRSGIEPILVWIGVATAMGIALLIQKRNYESVGATQ